MQLKPQPSPTWPRLQWVLLAVLFLAALGERLATAQWPAIIAERQFRSAIIARADYFDENRDIADWRREMARVSKQRQNILEPPILENIVALLYRLAGGVNLEIVRLLSTFGSGDYLDAQALRAQLRAECAAALLDVDVLAMPTTVSVAPEVTALDLEAGFADTPALHAACRFSFLGNLTGLPCGTAPVGSGEAGLPVGLQIVGDAFDEASVLAVLAHLERTGVAGVRAPRVPVHPLGQ